MLKNLLISTVLIFSMTSVAAADMKIGVVNVQEVYSKAPQAKTLNDKVQQQFKERYDALGALQKKGTDLQEKAQRDEMTLTNMQKMDIKRQLQELDSDFKLKQTFLQEDINIANKIEQSKIMRLIQDAVVKIAKDEKFDLILNAEAALHASPSVDISDKIIAIISKP